MDMRFLTEVRVFFLCGLLGICCGIVYDFIRIIRRILKPDTIGTLILDVLFWILCAVLTFCMLYYANYGRIRWYEWMGMGIGAGSYFLSVSSMVADGGTAFFTFLLKLAAIILTPLYSLLKMVRRFLVKIKTKISEKILKNLLTTERFWFRIKKRMKFCGKYLKK